MCHQMLRLWGLFGFFGFFGSVFFALFRGFNKDLLKFDKKVLHFNKGGVIVCSDFGGY